VVGLCPLLGLVPPLLARRAALGRRVLAPALAVLAVVAAARGLRDRPDEWTFPPDLLELGTRLAALPVPTGRPLAVVLGPGSHFFEQLPLAAWSGPRLSVRMAETTGLPGPPALGSHVDVWIERTPARVAALPVPPEAVIGRYHAYGPLASQLRRDADSLAHWERRDEDGRRTAMSRTAVLALEFTAEDPRPGSDAVLEQRVRRGLRPRRGALRVRAPYGHGFRYGRFAYQVIVDGRVLFQGDIASPSRWHTVRFEVPAQPGRSLITVRLLAGPQVEPGAGWGRASTVLVDRVEIDGAGPAGPDG
jgi:hypothetical protein